MTLKDIQSPVEQHLKDFNVYFKSLMKSDVALLDLVIQYLTRKKGKQMRPMLVLLSAELCGAVSQRSYVGAAMVELLHTATLIHDDVVDEAKERRGMPSINSAWSNKISVLIGDFLLAKGLLASIDQSEFDFLRATSHATRRMSEGELLQIQKSKDFKNNEDIYFTIIANKTASLMAACCEIGAISATDSKEQWMAMREFGEYIGIAFQLRDDIFDLQPRGTLLGKPVGNDLKEKKMTLPLIHALKQVTKKESKEIMSLIKDGNLKKKDIERIVAFVNDNGGISFTQDKAMEYIDKSLAILEQFPDSAAKTSLYNLSKYVLDRDL
jgi:octaprenyl-diphosphate synthase